MGNVWRFVVKRDAKAGKARYLRENNTVSGGWTCMGYHKSEGESETIYSIDEFLKMAEKDFNDTAAWNNNHKKSAWSFQYLIGERSRRTEYLKKSDYVWLFDYDENKYFVGKVIDDTFKLVIDDETVKYDTGTQLECVEYVKEGYDADDVLPFITGVEPRRTFTLIKSDLVYEYSDYVWKTSPKSNDKSEYHLDTSSEFHLNTPNAFLSSLTSEGVEDLVYAYLSSTSQLVLIPSTNKRNTPKYEFLMKDKDNNKYTLQVKNGGHINLDFDNYIKDLDKGQYKAIYLFTRNGFIKYNDKKLRGGLYVFSRESEPREIITQKELVDFATNKNNYWRLPDIVARLSKMYTPA